jgi:hypothetical protein
MPDSSGRLTPEDNAKIQAWWSKHWKAPVICPVCKTTDWTVADYVVNVIRHSSEALSGPTYPHIIVGCKTCAHAMFFNAVSIGLSPAWAPPLPPPPPVLGLAPASSELLGFGGLAALNTSSSSLKKKD